VLGSKQELEATYSIVEPLFDSLLATSFDFDPALHLSSFSSLERLECDFLALPAMRKYCITRNIVSDELMQSICVHIEKAHSEKL
jgi:hypothetical protein